MRATLQVLYFRKACACAMSRTKQTETDFLNLKVHCLLMVYGSKRMPDFCARELASGPSLQFLVTETAFRSMADDVQSIITVYRQ